MIDSHTHLSDEAFSQDLPQVLQRAQAAGVNRFVVVGQDLAENRKVLGMAEQDERLLPFLGLHPDRFADRAPAISEAEIADILQLIRSEAGRINGIGEVGLDYWVCQEADRRDAQREAFSALVDLARETDLPLNVHSRSAGHHTIDLLLEKNAGRVLMHAFDGKAGHALRGAEAGLVFSIPPSIARSPQKQKMVRALPLSAMVLETDSPVLGPEKGTRNEPANLAVSVQWIARIKGVEEEEVRETTLRTTRTLFGLKD